MPGTEKIVLRNERGQILPGSAGLPGSGHPEDEWRKELGKLARKILEEKDEGGQTVFERTARTLLAPIIGYSKAGDSYLVNERTILRVLEFLTTRGYGRAVDPSKLRDDGKGEPATGGIFVIIRAARPDRGGNNFGRGVVEVQLAAPKDANQPPG